MLKHNRFKNLQLHTPHNKGTLSSAFFYLFFISKNNINYLLISINTVVYCCIIFASV
ncbi:hypothetical protein SAMN04488097_1221 [Epilithonimonas lactis]|nr:hypothetical protein SAMN04488097_1221 [Epilithonimonas lactis]